MNGILVSLPVTTTPQLLHEHGYPVASAAVLEAAVLSGRRRVMAWALEQLLPPPGAARCSAAGGSGTAPNQPPPAPPPATEQLQAGVPALADAAGGAGAAAAAAEGEGETNANVGADEARESPTAPAEAVPAAAQPPSGPSLTPPPHPLEAALGGRAQAEHTGASLAVNAIAAGGGQALSVWLLDWLHARRLLVLDNPGEGLRWTLQRRLVRTRETAVHSQWVTWYRHDCESRGLEGYGCRMV